MLAERGFWKWGESACDVLALVLRYEQLDLVGVLTKPKNESHHQDGKRGASADGALDRSGICEMCRDKVAACCAATRPIAYALSVRARFCKRGRSGPGVSEMMDL